MRAETILRFARHDALRERALVHEERPRDLRCREADDGAEGEREPCVRRERRVAAGEEQRQPVVGLPTGRLRWAIGYVDPRGERSLPVPQPHPVHRVAVGGHLEPRARTLRRPVTPPCRQRLDHRALHGLLGEVEVAEPSRQPGHQRPGLLAQGAREEVVRGGRSAARHPSMWE